MSERMDIPRCTQKVCLYICLDNEQLRWFHLRLLEWRVQRQAILCFNAIFHGWIFHSSDNRRDGQKTHRLTHTKKKQFSSSLKKKEKKKVANTYSFVHQERDQKLSFFSTLSGWTFSLFIKHLNLTIGFLEKSFKFLS